MPGSLAGTMNSSVTSFGGSAAAAARDNDNPKRAESSAVLMPHLVHDPSRQDGTVRNLAEDRPRCQQMQFQERRLPNSQLPIGRARVSGRPNGSRLCHTGRGGLWQVVCLNAYEACAALGISSLGPREPADAGPVAK